MALVIEKNVTVITPSIGSTYLEQTVDSVLGQSYSNIRHLIVWDGPEYWTPLPNGNNPKIQMVSAPENTGSLGFYGHRIYAAYPLLIDSDYICFLDEDNWYEPNHIETLVKKLEETNSDFTFSFRNIVTKEGELVSPDYCESIGKWPIFFTQETPNNSYLIDTSSFCFKKEFIQNTCHHWNWGWGGDRRYLQIIRDFYTGTKYETTALPTLNYRLDDNMEKKYGRKDFFQDGNEKVKKFYGGEYPWM